MHTARHGTCGSERLAGIYWYAGIWVRWYSPPPEELPRLFGGLTSGSVPAALLLQGQIIDGASAFGGRLEPSNRSSGAKNNRGICVWT